MDNIYYYYYFIYTDICKYKICLKYVGVKGVDCNQQTGIFAKIVADVFTLYSVYYIQMVGQILIQICIFHIFFFY